MKGKNLEVGYLLDFYGDLLTDKQRDTIEMYYEEDLSLAEIAQHTRITRQGVLDCIKRGEALLVEMEDKLRLAKRFDELRKKVGNISSYAAVVRESNLKHGMIADIEINTAKIIDLANEIVE